MYRLAMHVAPDYKIRPIQTKLKLDWEKELSESGDIYHVITAEKCFDIVLADNENNYIAMLHSQEVR